jgi:hypothetical protein
MLWLKILCFKRTFYLIEIPGGYMGINLIGLAALVDQQVVYLEKSDRQKKYVWFLAYGCRDGLPNSCLCVGSHRVTAASLTAN